jgi:hypothetical protein
MNQVKVTFADGTIELVDERMLWSARLDGGLVEGEAPLTPPGRDHAPRDPLYAQYIASTDLEFALMEERARARDKDEAAELDRRLAAQTDESRRLWALYCASEPSD